jgi:hypothetical protein
MGGIRRGGRGQYDRRTPHAIIGEDPILLITLVVNLFGTINYIHYLCIDNVREMSGWGNNTSWSVDSHVRGRVRPLQPAFIYNKRIPIIIVMIYCIIKRLLLYLHVITILYITFPLIVYRLYCVLKDPVVRMYDWTINFLEL